MLTGGVHVADRRPHPRRARASSSELVASSSCSASLTALLLAICGLVVDRGDRADRAAAGPYDAAIFALSPLLVFHAFSNWDLLAMAFASARCGRGRGTDRCWPAR